jgi:membrane associated rhomboid family serine protease
MSEDQNDNPRSDEEDGEGRPASTPFDNPFFLPVLLGAFALWCAWDIITNDPAYQDHPWFNIGGLVIGGVLALYFTWSAVKERRAEREKSPD